MIYGHGDDIFSVKKQLIANFSSNVWNGGPDPNLIKALHEQLSSIKSYPEPNAQPLREACAKHHKLEDCNFIISNGTTESIYQVFHAFQGTSVVIPVPTFSEYEDAANLHRVTCRFIKWKALFAQKYFESKMVIICNPNNPTGHILSVDKIKDWLTNNPNTVFIIDEAYCAFTQYPQSVVDLVSQFGNLIVLRSLTKQFAIPGLRIGYIAAHKDLILKLLKYKIPWSVNTLALQAGLFILENYQKIKPNMLPALEETQWLQAQINKLEGYHCFTSATTFFLLENRRGSSTALKNYLLQIHHILIRDASNFKELDKRHIRIATQTKEENSKLIGALKLWKN